MFWAISSYNVESKSNIVETLTILNIFVKNQKQFEID